ncbi:DUF58 domain-containing protein [Paramagnetospirillum kuznetsovii]|uniref:DUF58 domain-containing protein n=1 Tax=Paramagnetospirillum kuznetsovii TaxID=2053833 RepID=A0A364P1W8_9PROT|nr:DUF58 domain-containing protein [Paramagnetospirillum kuznetsovii]RAU23313.1 DUF58 domain-containing protein [Paramagnetospirillum kuznetsovii]
MPTITSFRAQELAARLPPLLVAARRVAATVAQGAHGRRRAGPGEIFWQFRRSHPGDAASAIDWRQSARSDHLFLRESEWAAAQTVWLWRDSSASMDWRSTPELTTKGERADLLMLALAELLLRAGERVALLHGGLAPTTGRGALERLAEAMERGCGDIGGRSLPHHVPVVLMGDFLAPLDDIAGQIRRAGGQGHMVQILDPAEESLPYDGRVRFEGVEGEGQLLVRRAEALRAAYAERLAAHRDGLAALARASGWSLATHRTDHSAGPALLALYVRMAEGAA